MQTAVYRIAQAADQAKTLDELFKNIHNIVQTVMFADNFYIALSNKATDILEFPITSMKSAQKHQPNTVNRAKA